MPESNPQVGHAERGRYLMRIRGRGYAQLRCDDMQSLSALMICRLASDDMQGYALIKTGEIPRLASSLGMTRRVSLQL